MMAPQAAAATVRTLERGHTGADVVALQKRLAALTYWCGAADGSFGHLTQQAVWALQKVGGVARTGKVGATERGLLSRGVKPKPRTLSGHCIEVDLKRQILICGINGATSLVFNTSTGNGEMFESYGQQVRAVTPAGSYSVFRTVNGNDEGPLGDLWRPRYFNGGIAVHGAASVPGYPASHGCARVSNPAMDMLWAHNLMPVGSRVTVY